MKKSVKSINQCKSVIQTSFDIISAHGGVPKPIGIKVETLSAEAAVQAGNEGEGCIFIIKLPITG